ncbi:hypothetical protein SXCC_04682 [Gluconacetobacter sp. SXCC-1]|nr:hypothetical protein SXCC_04682 [Gluconacetobacter sp. SXCC-1]
MHRLSFGFLPLDAEAGEMYVTRLAHNRNAPLWPTGPRPGRVAAP